MKLDDETHLVSFTYEYIPDTRWQLRIRGISAKPKHKQARVDWLQPPDCWLTVEGKRVGIKRHDGTVAQKFDLEYARKLFASGEWLEIWLPEE